MRPPGTQTTRWRRGAAQARWPADEVRGNRRRVGGQQHRRAGRLAEVEVLLQLAEQRLVLADVGPAVGTAVGPGVEPGAAEEVILDELQVRVAAERLVVDDTLPGVRGDDDPRDPQAVAVLVDRR